MIFFDETSKTFYLEGKGMTYAFDIFAEEGGEPEHLWFGAALPRDDLRFIRSSGATTFEAAPPNQRWTENMMTRELPLYGRGDYREPMLVCRGENGGLAAKLLYVGHRITEAHTIPGMPSTHGGQTLEVTMRDDLRGMEVTLFYTVFDDVSAIARSCRIRNTGSGPLSLSRAFSFSLDLPGMNYDTVSLYGAWARERMPERAPIHHGVSEIASRRGSSSASLNPFLGLVSRATTETAGDAWGFSLVYSSSFRLLAEGAQNGSTRVCGGISDLGFGEVLAPGESFDTPQALLVYSGEGLGGLSRAFHDLFREHIIPVAHAKTPRPLVINNWEATSFTFDYEKLFAIIDASAGRGIDTFVLDDGWFGVRNNDRSGLGDWFVNTDKLPQGLTPIIDRCHERGLRFGLWFEPEMVNPDSDLYRRHPDWAVHCPGYEPLLCRHQLMLDLTRTEVRDYLVETINGVLDTNDIDYVKWDSNRTLTEMHSESLPPERQGAFLHRWVLGLYDLLDRIVVAHPGIFFEGCSGGGGRFDAGMLAYFPQIWTSDDTDAGMRARIQYGTSLIYPLSAASCHVSDCPNHITKRMIPFGTRADIAHLGASGYELDASQIPVEELDAIAGQTEAYRKMEKLVLEGDLYRIASPFTSPYFAFQLVAKDKSEAHLTVMRQMRDANEEVGILYPAGLDPAALYLVEETGERRHGETLMKVGIRLKGMRDFESMTRHFVRVD